MLELECIFLKRRLHIRIKSSKDRATRETLSNCFCSSPCHRNYALVTKRGLSDLQHFVTHLNIIADILENRGMFANACLEKYDCTANVFRRSKPNYRHYVVVRDL